MLKNYSFKNGLCKYFTKINNALPFVSKTKSIFFSQKLLLIALFSILLGNKTSAQVSSYAFSQPAGTYSGITGTTVHASGWDDAVVAVAIPFTFNFNTVPYTSCSVNSNGYITFGATPSGTTDYNPISGTTGYSGAVSAFGRDLVSNASIVEYATTGSSPNRVFVVQWTNARRYSGAPVAGDVLNFQIRLYETTNVVEIMYGSNAATSNSNAITGQVGLRGSANTDFNNRSGGNNTAWASLAAGGANNNTVNFKSGLVPASGLTFRWSPPTPTITSLGSASGCPGTNIIINGTNFTGATAANVRIGGTAVSSIVSNTGTVLTAVIGAGTTGLVTVTTAWGTATSNPTNFTVNTPPTITLSSGAGTNSQTGCINTPITSFTHTIGGSATGASTVGLPAGVTGSLAGSVYTISGTPTVSGTFNYTITTSGGSCAGATAIGTITVNAVPAITTNPVNSSIAPGANTSFTVAASSSPTSYTWEVSTNGGGSWSTVVNGGVYSNATTATLNITAAPIGMDGYQYRAKATNSCGTSAVSTAALLTVAPIYCTPTSNVSTRYINSVQTIGNLTNMSNLNTGRAATGYANYTALPTTTQIPGGGVNVDYILAVSRQYMRVWVDWNKDGTFTDAAPELVYTTGGVQTIAGSFGFVVPIATTPGNYRMRMRTFEAAQAFSPCGNLATGEAEDYSITVIADCPAKITSVTDGSRCEPGTVVLTAVGTAGTSEFRWYDARTGGSLVGTSPTGTWTTPSIAVTTEYYVTAYNGSCESLFREKVIAVVNPTSIINVTPSAPEVCGENNIISIAANGDLVLDYLIDENFETGTLGVFTRVNTSADANTEWAVHASPYIPTGSVWKPAINSRTIGNQFALSVSDFAAPAAKDMSLQSTATYNTNTFSDLFLNFRHYFSYYAGDPTQVAEVQVKSGAGPWTTVQNYTSTQGYAGQFADVTINLSAYINVAALQIRFRYAAGFADGWAIDDVRLYGTKQLNTTFSWSGSAVDAYIDPACTIPYVAQSVTTIYVKPTALQLQDPTWSFTATATLGNGCPVSKLINVNNKTKIWQGASNNWNDPNNWLPAGVPDINTCVVINSAPFPSNLGIAPSGNAKNLIVKTGATLEVQPANSLTVKEVVTVNAGGTFNIKNTGSLVQIDNVANIGNITMERTANIRKFDYVYWSSPVGGAGATFPVTSVSTATTANFIWKWLPTNGSNLNGFGNWISANENMTLGKGYIVRGPNNFSTATAAPFTASFNGIPNNGSINMQITRGTYDGANYAGPTTTIVTKDDDNWNLIGNPYPSAIRALDFLTANPSIDGNVRIWTHGTSPSTGIADPFYQNYQYNYSTADYIVHNGTGTTSGPAGFDGYIGAGQGFFVLMNHTAATPGTVSFANTMRNSTYDNTDFYRSSTSENDVEKNRIWLDFIAPSGNVNRILVGYVQGATQERDRMFDATAQENVTQNFYSRIADENMVIQGRSLPFDENDQVPLGVLLPQNGTCTIGIASVDGIFANANQSIYLEDLTTGAVHNLRSTPYSFTANAGTINNRFVLRYNNATLSVNELDYANGVKIFANSNINIASANESIKQVTVYDVLGKTLLDKKNIGKKEVVLTDLKPTTNVLIVKVILDNNAEVVKKVIY